MNEFNIGETVWHACCGDKELKKACPVCFGKLSVRVELGNGDMVTTPCDYCGKGWEGPRGVVTEYEWHAASEAFIITGKDVSERDGDRQVTYRTINRYASAEDVFSTREEADAHCAIKIAEEEAIQKKRMEFTKENAKKTFSWHVGYHMRCAEKARKELAYHEAKAIHSKARAKTPVVEETA